MILMMPNKRKNMKVTGDKDRDDSDNNLGVHDHHEYFSNSKF